MKQSLMQPTMMMLCREPQKNSKRFTFWEIYLFIFFAALQ